MKLNGQKVTNAVLRKDIEFLQQSQEEVKSDIKEIKSMIQADIGKTAALEGQISTLKWIFGSVLTILGLAIGYVGLR